MTKSRPLSFLRFTEEAFTLLHPGTTYEHNWHISLISHELERLQQNKQTRLIITMPPRHMKSLLVSVIWPAWLMAQDPSKRIIAASYSKQLSTEHSELCQHLILSEWFQSHFPATQIARGTNRKQKFATTQHGFRMATAIGASLMGSGADFLIVDDPHNPSHMHSKALRHKALHWYEHTLITRLNQPEKGGIVVVMQRLHENDLVGYLLEKNPQLWRHINLPLVAEEESLYRFKRTCYTRKKGDILHPARMSAKHVEQIQLEQGRYFFSAQYQQNPVPQEGMMLKRSYFGYYNQPHDKLLESRLLLIQSWDTACKTEDHHSYSACTTWMLHQNGQLYLIDAFRAHLIYSDLKHQVEERFARYPCDMLLIEDAQTGQVLLSDLQRERKIRPLLGIRPKTSKEHRFASITCLFEARDVIFPESAPWLASYEKELLIFPRGQYSDLVDSTSQGLQYLRERRDKFKEAALMVRV